MKPGTGPTPLFRFDEALKSFHQTPILVGVDEAGRGPLAGPVVAAAVVLPENFAPELAGVRDSKTLSAERRSSLFDSIRRSAVQVGVGWASSAEIDRVNIFQATLYAMRRAVGRLKLPAAPGILVAVDGPWSVPGLAHAQKPLVKGDRYSMSIAAAGIVAKVVRDRWMKELDRRFPGYGLSVHKGYATQAHREALNRLGPSPIHRRSFEPVSQASLPLSP